VVVTNGDGEGLGSDISFSTMQVGINGLPDGRVYEMVTPPDKEDAEVYAPESVDVDAEPAKGVPTANLVAVASDGNAVVYEGEPTHSGGGESNGTHLGSAYLARRLPGGGWTSSSIQPAGRRYTVYAGFSPDLTIGVLTAPTENLQYEEHQLPGGEAPVGKEGEVEYYDLYEHGLTEEDYSPLFTGTPLRDPMESSGIYWNTVDARPSGEEGPQSPSYGGATANMSDILFGINDDALHGGGGPIERELEEDVKSEVLHKNNGNEYLYDSNDGQPSLVDVLPDGKVAPGATFGAPPYVGQRAPDLSHAISSDGSRVFWTALEGENQIHIGSGGSTRETAAVGALYVRENPNQPQSPLNDQGECVIASDACTVQVDKQAGGGGRFWTASADGSKVFFTATHAGDALYEFDLDTGVTKDLTPGVEVEGVVGASEDGSFIYYANRNHGLFMLREEAGSWRAPVLIAALSEEDGTNIRPFQNITSFATNRNGRAGDWVPDMGLRTAEVTPDGQGLTFMSNMSLKTQGFPDGYRNEGQEEVYVYDAVDDSLFCASCDPTGEAPQTSLETPSGFEDGAAAVLPVGWGSTYTPTMISEDGDRVFFQSGMPLVPRDTNGEIDVYEWEREGSGSCGDGEGADGGCIYLLSGGASNEPSWLLGASASGSDVFMISRGNFTAEQDDELYKVFDAKVEGYAPVPPPPCTGTGCQGIPAAPPTFATPSSVTFAGIGNFSPSSAPSSSVKSKAKSLTRAQLLARALAECRRKRKGQRHACELQAKKRYGSKAKAKRRSSSERKGK
jgi:hypothetical protein